MRFEADFRAVAEAKIDGRPLPGRLRHDRLEASPVADNLIELLLFEIVIARTVFFDAPPPILGGLGVLPPVFENFRKLAERIFAVPGLRLVGNLLVDANEIEFLRQLEPLDAIGQPSNRFIVS